MATAQSSMNSIPVGGLWLPDGDAILVKDILAAGSEDLARSRSEELIRALHPKMKTAAIKAKLAASTPEGSPQWSTAAFWMKEIDLVLLEGIHNGRNGQGDVIKRLCDTWPWLDSQILQQRMEELANQGLPAFLCNGFWHDIDPILIAGLKAGGQAVFKAVGKVEREFRELRVEVIWARVRRLRKRAIGKREKGMRYKWTDELEEELLARSSIVGLSAAVSEICQKTGWSRAAVVRRAHKLGVPIEPRGGRVPWTEADRNFLVQSICHVPVRAIAHELGRTENAVWCKIWEEGLTARYEADHSQRELCRKLHVRAPIVRGWIEKGWLKLGRNRRIKDRVLRAFLEEHGDEINWDRADRGWLEEVNAKGEEGEDEEQAMEHEPKLPDAIPQRPSAARDGSGLDRDRRATSTRARGPDENPERQNNQAHAANLQS
ncbi:MAG TPA: hypothetical protein VKX49_16430 [Bryobacteraceae bacterium]|nr:hypothetical protein [Bryobacteraceae bacterium]